MVKDGSHVKSKSLVAKLFQTIEICFKAIVRLCFVEVKKGRKKSWYSSKFFFDKITKIGVISTIGLEEIVQKIVEFEKSGLDYKLLLRQVKGPEEKFK